MVRTSRLAAVDAVCSVPHLWPDTDHTKHIVDLVAGGLQRSGVSKRNHRGAVAGTYKKSINFFGPWVEVDKLR